jgi:hypothetical protein
MDVTDHQRALLQHYEEKYAEFGLMIAHLRRELGMSEAPAPSAGSDPSSPPPNGVAIGLVNVSELVSPGFFFGKSQVEAVRAFLELTRRQPASLRDIAHALHRGGATEDLIDGPGPLRNLSSVLSRARHVVVSVKRGYWGLVEWYPDRAVRRARRPRADQDSPAEGKADGGSS